MPIDDSNILRVDLYEIFKEAEHLTSIKSRMIEDDALAQKIIISPDEYILLVSFMNDATSIIADAGSYVYTSEMSGLDSLTDRYTEENPNPNDEFELQDLNWLQKKSGELLKDDQQPILIFSMPELEGSLVYKWTVVQTFIKGAILEYILHKWYRHNGLNEDAAMAYQMFEMWVDKIRFNSVSNIKNIGKSRKFRPYG